ncbi:helix-turn-helix domain-containing protein [Cytobacillus praedii]|uniref:XRE family transcriptional regulator n=1 Tax=Cytobacillus praedii TaxID=1742358 RepID=A0A4R1AX98_9BACI|nr:helix-turn-helix transcriptional regulator [Cytobacillus praedii]TCJ05092.1 XRE family transcriptional regulator [Cytobacillus praedii]
MFGLGKKRSKFGKWLDRKGISQLDLSKKSKVSRNTISEICNEKEHNPRISTWVKIEKALKRMGYDVNRNDFFDM